MKKEYKIGKGWAVFIWIFAPALIGLFVFLGVMPYLQTKFDLTLALILTPTSIGMVVFSVIGLIDSFRSKLIIEKKRIISIGAFKTKRLDFKAIKGFKRDQYYLYFIPESEELKRIKVSSYFGKFAQLSEWAESKFKNLDLEEVIDDAEEILRNEAYGHDQEEREYNLNQTRKKTKILNTVSFVIALSTLVYPHFYDLQIILCAVLPVVGFTLVIASKGLIKFDDTPNSIHPNLMSTIYMPSGALTVRALLDYNVFSYANFWTPALILFALLTLLFFYKLGNIYDFKKGAAYLALLGILFFGSMYGYGLVITSNAILDKSVPEVYKAKIINKSISSGKSTTYYLELDAWGPQSETKKVSVSKQLYNRKKIGETAVIQYFAGKFNIPYYMVVK